MDLGKVRRIIYVEPDEVRRAIPAPDIFRRREGGEGGEPIPAPEIFRKKRVRREEGAGIE